MKLGVGALVALGLAACGSDPTPTGSVCPPGSTLTYESFGAPFMEEYCTHCHDSDLHGSDRHGAPLFHDFDTLITILQVDGHIDEQAAAGPDATNEIMPPSSCPDGPCARPTQEERRQLGEWLACAAEENENPPDAGGELPDAGPPDATP